MTWVWIFIGGGVGSICRHITGLAFSPSPWGVLTVNVLGSFLGGYLLALNLGSEWVRFTLIVGFLGGFTTYSAFSMEFVRYIESGEISAALVFVSLNVFLSLFACFLGFKFV